MTRIDLDDLPPKVAQLLTGAEPGEEILLVQGGLVVGRLVGGEASAPAAADEEAALTDEQRAAEVFEQFRSLMEDEY